MSPSDLHSCVVYKAMNTRARSLEDNYEDTATCLRTLVAYYDCEDIAIKSYTFIKERI